MLESLEGKKGQPRFKPPFPAGYGIYGKPTTINNPEPFAAVPWIFRHSAQEYLEIGLPNARATKIFSITVDVEHQGKSDNPLGQPLSQPNRKTVGYGKRASVHVE